MVIIQSPKLYINDILAGPRASKGSYRPDMTSIDKQKLIDELKKIFNELHISKEELFEKNENKVGLTIARYIEKSPDLTLINICKKVFVPFAKNNADLIFPDDENILPLVTNSTVLALPPAIPAIGTTVEILEVRKDAPVIIPMKRQSSDINWPDIGNKILTSVNYHRNTKEAKELFIQALQSSGFSKGDIELAQKRGNILSQVGELLHLEPAGVERILDKLFPESVKAKIKNTNDDIFDSGSVLSGAEGAYRLRMASRETHRSHRDNENTESY